MDFAIEINTWISAADLSVQEKSAVRKGPSVTATWQDRYSSSGSKRTGHIAAEVWPYRTVLQVRS